MNLTEDEIEALGIDKLTDAERLELQKEHLIKSERVFHIEDAPLPIQEMFKLYDGVDTSGMSRVDKSIHRGMLYYESPSILHPDNLAPLRVVSVGSRLGSMGHLGKLWPISLDQARDRRGRPTVGEGQGLAALKHAALYSGNKDEYRLPHVPTERYADVFGTPGVWHLYGVSEKALEIILKHVSPTAVEVVGPIEYEDVEVAPEQDFYLLDVVRKTRVIDLFRSNVQWRYPARSILPDYISAFTVSGWKGASICEGVDVDIARDSQFPREVFVSRVLLDAMEAADLSGIQYKGWT